MEYSKRSRHLFCFSSTSFILLLLCMGWACEVVNAQESASSDQKQIEALVKEVLSKEKFYKLAFLGNFKVKKLKHVSEKSVVQIYKKYKEKLLTDFYNYNNPEKIGKIGYNLPPLKGLLKLAQSVDSESFFQKIEQDVDHITFENNVTGWGKIEYLKNGSCAYYIFKSLFNRYGPSKLAELNERFVQNDQKRLRKFLFLTIIEMPLNTLKKDVGYLKVLSEIVSTQEFNYSEEELASSRSLRKELLNEMYFIYTRLKPKQRKKARKILRKFNLYDEIKLRSDEG